MGCKDIYFTSCGLKFPKYLAIKQALRQSGSSVIHQICYETISVGDSLAMCFYFSWCMTKRFLTGLSSRKYWWSRANKLQKMLLKTRIQSMKWTYESPIWIFPKCFHWNYWIRWKYILYSQRLFELLLQETRILPQHQQDTGNRQNL